jgi:hypothetical protein
MVDLDNDVWLEVLRHFFADGLDTCMTNDALILSSISKRWQARLPSDLWLRVEC